MAGVNANHTVPFGDFSVGPTLGLLYARNTDKSHVTTAGQRVDRFDTWAVDVSGGVQGAYSLSNDLELGGSLTYARDLIPSLRSNSLVRQSDKDMVEASVRLTWFHDDNATAYAQASHNFSASDRKATTATASVRYSF